MALVSDLDKTIARALTIRYVLALAFIAALTIGAQILIQVALVSHEDDAALINAAGRQRRLSQQLCKAALAWRLSEDPTRQQAYAAEIERVRSAWMDSQRELRSGAVFSTAGRRNSPAAAAALAAIDSPFTAMAEAAAQVTSDPQAIERLLREEPAFLTGMEAVVAQYDREAAGRVRLLRVLEVILASITLLALAAEAWLVFNPAVRRIRAAIKERERLSEHEVENRELAAEARAARAIGQDLHDGLGQTLTALGLQARLLANRLEGEPRQQAETILATATQAVGEARAAAHRLAPVAIQAAGLAGALNALARLTETTGCHCFTTLAELPELPAESEEHLYRVAQEAIANAQRHGRASSISIALERIGDAAELRIADDGTWQPPTGDGFGLRSMRIRAERVGGTLALSHPESGGTLVILRFPVPT